MSNARTVVFLHGWSVRSTDTYGKLPERLVADGAKAGLQLAVRNIWLGKYVSFRDEVRIGDISRAMESAVRTELKDLLDRGERFACVTHSTGGPVARDWWNRFYLSTKATARTPCPMSHLIMLAPANFGSALAQLGKSRLSRVKTWFQGVEPGTGVLDWLELGSAEAWDLNRKWMDQPPVTNGPTAVYPFVLTGQTVDHRLYDHLNSYTGEAGSDGVVRVAAANLNATCVRLVQEAVRLEKGKPVAPKLAMAERKTAPPSAFKILPGRSHSGADIGIMRSVRDDGKPHPTVSAVLDCLRIGSRADYEALRSRFESENAGTQEAERVEIHDRILLPGTVTVTDRYSMILFRVRDDQGARIGDFDLRLVALPPGVTKGAPSPDLLPKDFFRDRQRNQRDPGTLTYYVNADIMKGCDAARDPDSGRVVRAASRGAGVLGFALEPHLAKGFVHFVAAELEGTPRVLSEVVRPNQTTLVEIVMRRVVREGVLRLAPLSKRSDRDFSKDPSGDPLGS